MVPEHPTPPDPGPANVGRAVADALVTGGSTADLERVVRAYVRTLRDADVPPERALMRVKDAVGVSRVTPLPARGAPPSDHLGDRVVAWFLAEYYRAD